MSDIIRVLRFIEYTGERSAVESQLKASLPDGEKQGVTGCLIRIGTLGVFPEILNKVEQKNGNP